MDPFDDALTRSPDDEALWSAYADWHEAHGDPRAELMRTFSDALVTTHWASWFPNIDAKSVLLTWKHGFVTFAQVERAVDVATLLALPSMKWLRSLTLLRPSTLGDVGALPLLSSVAIIDASDLPTAELAKLSLIQRLDVPHSVLKVVTAATSSERVRVGHGSLDGLRYAVSRTPQHAPQNVLSLAQWTETRRPSSQSEDPAVTGFGAGRAVSKSARLKWCPHCPSGRVVEVFAETSTSYSHFETTVYETHELRCASCRHFTSYRTVHER